MTDERVEGVSSAEKTSLPSSEAKVPPAMATVMTDKVPATLEELRKAFPELHDQLAKGIMGAIGSDMKRHNENVKKLREEGERGR